MKIVIFGLTITSSWGNGHATLWRGLCRALGARGHRVVFFERDVPYYAAHRDLGGVPWCRVELYDDWNAVRDLARRDLLDADAGIVTSYCPDARDAAALVLESGALHVFYDLDSPITLERVARGESVPYLPSNGLRDFDLVLSYAGGGAVDALKGSLGARAVAPLYGSVDPDMHRCVPQRTDLRNRLSYLGTYAADRQPLLEELFIEAARHRPRERFVLAGSQYPADFPWEPNIFYLRHLAPVDHAGLFCSSDWSLNITRAAMAATGYCPSGRLFEAAACGAAIVTDSWPGLSDFFEPGAEVLAVGDTADVLTALDLSDRERRTIGDAARARALACHTASARAAELEHLLDAPSLAPAGAA
jgi:spore maturation protein CgeB